MRASLAPPVASLEGAGALIGRFYPTTHYLTISRGVFSKALAFSDLRPQFLPLLLAALLLLGLGTALLRKQAT